MRKSSIPELESKKKTEKIKTLESEKKDPIKKQENLENKRKECAGKEEAKFEICYHCWKVVK